jgi:hypothetical protein
MQSEVEMDKLMAQLQEVDDKIKEEVLPSPCTLMPTLIPT